MTTSKAPTTLPQYQTEEDQHASHIPDLSWRIVWQTFLPPIGVIFSDHAASALLSKAGHPKSGPWATNPSSVAFFSILAFLMVLDPARSQKSRPLQWLVALLWEQVVALDLSIGPPCSLETRAVRLPTGHYGRAADGAGGRLKLPRVRVDNAGAENEARRQRLGHDRAG